MKKYIVAAVAVLMLGGLAWAADDPSTGAAPSKSESGMTKKDHMSKKEYIEMKDGKMMVMKEGKETPMTENMTMSNGTVVMPDGSYTMKDGTKKMMTEGEKMHMNGKIMSKGKAKHKSMEKTGETGQPATGK